MLAAVEARHARDGEGARAEALDLRAHGLEQLAQVADLRLQGGVPQDADTFGQGRGHEDVLSGAHAHLLEGVVDGFQSALHSTFTMVRMSATAGRLVKTRAPASAGPPPGRAGPHSSHLTPECAPAGDVHLGSPVGPSKLQPSSVAHPRKGGTTRPAWPGIRGASRLTGRLTGAGGTLRTA